MTDAMKLAVDERVPGRPFTDPAHSPRDLARMRSMARQLLESYDDPAVCDFLPGQRPVCQSDPQGRHFRIYYVQPKLLFSRKELTIVGFFGHKRPGADIAPLVEADKRFERTFHDHPGLLSLSTVRLPEGDYANLVVFTDPDAKDHWNRTPMHYDTVSRISPPYYEHIRLNNAYLPDGLDSPEAMELIRVRYVDYDEEPAWRAVRQFGDYPE
jgi:hypothetical protein